MVNLSASVGIKAMMDTTAVERGCEKTKKLFEGVGRKAKETNVFFERTTGILGELTGLAKGFGVGLLGALTGVVAASPHFKAFMASLKGPWYKLTQYLGSQFKPMLDKVSAAFKGFVSWFTTNEGIQELLGFLADTGGRMIDITAEFGGDAAKLLFGDETQKGLIPWLGETYTGIKRTLNLSIDSDTETLGMMAAAMLVMGHPGIAAMITGFAVAKEIKKITGPTEAFEGVPFVGQQPNPPFFLGGLRGTIDLMLTIFDKTRGGTNVSQSTPNPSLEVSI